MAGPDLIPADVRARLKGLRLVSRRVSGALGIGQHHSRSRGAGMEFAQYRAYEPGDEPRQIDWKLYARSDKFFVRESERDSPLAAWVLLDASASMAQSDAVRPGWSRLQAAKVQAACLFELACRQGDRFGLIAVSGDRLQVINAGSGTRHRDRCLQVLGGLTAAGAWPDEAGCRPIWERIHANDLVLLLSDDFDERPLALSERLAAARREVLNIQIMTVEERDFPFRDGRRFIDVESGATVLTDAAAARDDYLHAFSAACRELALRLNAAGIRHVPYVLDEGLDAPLQRLFAQGKARFQEGA
ncbi:MAG: DUF58 domain-containing protein [Xanthomonadaceae bacterium]|nr:DUF58 domain-containing protein [Xanthomonadaceae bacterium]